MSSYLGLEGEHAWNGLTMNKLNVWPRFKLDKISGLWGAWEYDNNVAPRTGSKGLRLYPSYRRGKSVVYEGRMGGRDLGELDAGRAAFDAAMNSTAAGLNVERVLTISPRSGFAGSVKNLAGYLLQAEMDEEQVFGRTHVFGGVFTPWVREFTVGIEILGYDVD